MTKDEKGSAGAEPVDDGYTIRRPGRPKKSPTPQEGSAPPEGKSLRFEMRLPPGIVADLETMQKHTGNTFATYIRRAIQRALKEDQELWKK